MKILKHIPPNLIMPEFIVDIPLSKHLNDDPLLSNMNKSFSCGLIGKAGSGKTSLMTALLQTPKKFKKVFHQIFLFMPSSSRKSMKKNVFDQLPEDQKFEGVNFENLNVVYSQLLENSENKKFSLLIFDDVQTYLKNKEVEFNLLHIITNRRHLRTSIFIVAQNYKKIPIQIRMGFSDLFLFNVSKEEYKYVFEELVNIFKNEFIQALKLYRKEKELNKNSFLYLHDYDKLFINYNEIINDDEDYDDL